jgi:hypothetical protein
LISVVPESLKLQMDNLIFADLNIFVHSFPGGFYAYGFGALVLLALLIIFKFLYRRDHYPLCCAR